MEIAEHQWQLLQTKSISLPFLKESYPMCQVSAIQERSRSVSHTSPTTLSNHSSWLQRKNTCTHKNNPHLPAASKTKPKPWKACCGKLFLKDPPSPGQTLLPACSHPVPPAHWSMHTIYSATFFRKVSLPNKDGSPQERYPIFCGCHCLTCCKILPHFAHYIISI